MNYLTSNITHIDQGSFDNRKSDPLTGFRKDVFSFHSPDTTFTQPFLSVQEIKKQRLKSVTKFFM